MTPLEKATMYLSMCNNLDRVKEYLQKELSLTAKRVTEFIDDIVSGNVNEEDVSKDWQRSIIQKINEELFATEFSITPVVIYEFVTQSLENIQKAAIHLRACGDDVLDSVVAHFHTLFLSESESDIDIKKFIDSIRGHSVDYDLMRFRRYNDIINRIADRDFLDQFGISMDYLKSTILEGPATLEVLTYHGDDSSDEGDHRKVNEYDELGSVARLLQEEGAVISALGLNSAQMEGLLSSAAIRLSFISHALGVELLYSKGISESYYDKKNRHLVHKRSTNDVLDVSAFKKMHDTENFVKSISANRFMNRNVKRVIKDIQKDQKPNYVREQKTSSAGSPYEYWLFSYDSFVSFSNVNVRSKHEAYTKSKATRSHQVITGLHREDYVTIAGFLDSFDNAAEVIRSILNDEIKDWSFDSDEQRDTFAAITFLLFMCETSRSPAAYLHNQMLLDLLIDKQIKNWSEAFKLMPMGPPESVYRARAVEDIYRKYLPIKYSYDYTNGKTDKNHKLLIQREAVLTKKWLEYKRVDLSVTTTKGIVDILKESIIDWYGIDLNHDDEYLYTEDDMSALLNYYLSDQQLYHIMPQTQFENAALLSQNLQIAIERARDGCVSVIPLHLHYNHWVGVVIRLQEDDKIEVIYVDPMGNIFETEDNALAFIKAITALEQDAHIVDLKFVQQRNGHDCGPFTVSNLVRLARAKEEGCVLDNLSAEEIIGYEGLLERPSDGSAAHLRPIYSEVLNPILVAAAATQAVASVAHTPSMAVAASVAVAQLVEGGVQSLSLSSAGDVPSGSFPNPSPAPSSQPSHSPTWTTRVEVSREIIAQEWDTEAHLEALFSNKVKVIKSQDSTQIASTLNDIAKIEAMTGKEMLIEIVGFYQYVSAALSNNPLSVSATKVIQDMGRLFNNLEEWLDLSAVYENIDIDNQVAIILTQLEYWFDFVASGTTYVGLPSRYPGFDPGDDYDGGSSSGSGDWNPNNEQNADPLILLVGQNATNTTITHDS